MKFSKKIGAVRNPNRRHAIDQIGARSVLTMQQSITSLRAKIDL
jgi:hypothetical protein